MNSILASEEYSDVWQKADAGENLNEVERTQFLLILRMYFSQANLMRRLFGRGIATEDELREAYGPLRNIANRIELARELIIEMAEGGSGRVSELVLDENGLENFIQMHR